MPIRGMAGLCSARGVGVRLESEYQERKPWNSSSLSNIPTDAVRVPMDMRDKTCILCTYHGCTLSGSSQSLYARASFAECHTLTQHTTCKSIRLLADIAPRNFGRLLPLGVDTGTHSPDAEMSRLLASCKICEAFANNVACSRLWTCLVQQSWLDLRVTTRIPFQTCSFSCSSQVTMLTMPRRPRGFSQLVVTDAAGMAC